MDGLGRQALDPDRGQACGPYGPYSPAWGRFLPLSTGPYPPFEMALPSTGQSCYMAIAILVSII